MIVKMSERLTTPPFSEIETMVQTCLIGTTDKKWLVQPASQDNFDMVHTYVGESCALLRIAYNCFVSTVNQSITPNY